MHATCHVLSYSDPTVYLATTHFSTYAEARVGNLCTTCSCLMRFLFFFHHWTLSLQRQACKVMQLQLIALPACTAGRQILFPV